MDDSALLEPEVPVVMGVGARLRAAREARGMDIDSAAATLKLSRRQVDALEAGEWSKLPGHTFIRGFVRNYARVLQIDAAPLLADLEMPELPAPRLDLPANATTVMPESGAAQKKDYAAVLAGLVMVAIAVVAYYVVPPDLWLSKPATVASVAKDDATPVQLFPPGATPTGVLPPSEAAGAPAGGDATTAVRVPESPVVISPPPATASSKVLRFTFAQPSWVEVRDKSGQIIYSQLNPAGSEREIEGQPPYALVVGNAGHVMVRYQGRTIDLQPRSKDDVARVTVE